MERKDQKTDKIVPSRQVPPHRYFRATTFETRQHPETGDILHEEQQDVYAVHPDNLPADWETRDPERKWYFLNEESPATHPIQPDPEAIADPAIREMFQHRLNNDQFGFNISGTGWIRGNYYPHYEDQIDPRSMKVTGDKFEPKGYTVDDWDNAHQIGALTVRVDEAEYPD